MFGLNDEKITVGYELAKLEFLPTEGDSHFYLMVTQGFFAGDCYFYLDDSLLPKMLEKATSMYDNMRGSFEMQNCTPERGFVKFEFVKNRLRISGIIKDDEKGPELKFGFVTDQTAMVPLITLLKKLQT